MDFKEYIENRSVDDIMEAYGEQRDEWQTLLTCENGNVVQFRHGNGKNFFCEQYECTVDEKKTEILTGKTVQEQMEHYYVTQSANLYKTAYGEITDEKLREKAVKLCDYDGVIRLLLNEKILVGAKIRGHWGVDVLLPEKSVCTCYACDNEGSGTNEREDYAYLIFKES